jgi:hypothetical protein
MRDLSDRKLGAMFQLDDGSGPARPLDDARTAAIIAAALGGAGFAALLSGPSGSTPSAGGAVSAAKGVGTVKLALLIGGAAGIAFATWAGLRSSASPRAAPAQVVAAVTAPPPVAAPPPPPVEAPTDQPAADDPDVELGAPDDPAPPHAAKPARRGRARVPRPAAVASAPEDLLATANAARAAHHWRKADALYARVVSGDPTELATQAALVASASLHLEHLGDPAGAARRFRAALAAGPGDALAEDARWGLAESARATGDPAAELAALDEFIAHHAGSPRAARARVRRGELKAAP